MPSQSIILPFEDERFWAKVNFDGPLPEHHSELGSCWLWMAAKTEDGCGLYRFNHRTKKAHRHAYEMTYGPIPDGLLVCHACDRPNCVRPSHFRLGTNKDNSDDKMRKRRDAYSRHGAAYLDRGVQHWTHRNPGTSPVIGTKGASNPLAKLTDDDVRAIRRRYAAGDISQKALAAEYGVSQTIIHHLLARKTWAHVPDDSDITVQPRQPPNRKGELCGHAKITADDVRAIRALAASGASLGEIAARFGIGRPNACLIVNRKTWRHVD